MTTPGGEEAFVSDMVWEGVTLDQRCRYVLSLYGSWCLLVFEPFSQMVHPHARKAVVSHCSGYAPARSLDIPWHPKTNETTFTCGFAYRSPTTLFLNWFKATHTAGRPHGLSQTNA